MLMNLRSISLPARFIKSLSILCNPFSQTRLNDILCEVEIAIKANLKTVELVCEIKWKAQKSFQFTVENHQTPHQKLKKKTFKLYWNSWHFDEFKLMLRLLFAFKHAIETFVSETLPY